MNSCRISSIYSILHHRKNHWNYNSNHLVGGLQHFVPYIGNFIIPTDELIFFRGVGQPPTRLTIIYHGKSPFSMGKSPFWMGKSPFWMGKSPFWMGKSIMKIHHPSSFFGKHPLFSKNPCRLHPKGVQTGGLSTPGWPGCGAIESWGWMLTSKRSSPPNWIEYDRILKLNN